MHGKCTTILNEAEYYFIHQNNNNNNTKELQQESDSETIHDKCNVNKKGD